MALNTNVLSSGATAYLPLVTQAADNAGVPEGIFAALVQHESSYNPTAVGGSGDYGLAQITPIIYNAKQYNNNGQLSYAVPAQNAQIGANYLADMYKKYGNWTDALSAYNSGKPASQSSAGSSYAAAVLAIASTVDPSSQLGNTNATNVSDAVTSGSSIDPTGIYNSIKGIISGGASNVENSASAVADAATGNFGSAITSALSNIGPWIKNHLVMIMVGLLALLVIAYSAFSLIPARAQTAVKSGAKIAALV